MSNTTAAIIGLCIPFVIVVIAQFFTLHIEPYIKSKIEQRRSIKSIKKLPYNKGERVLNKEQQDAIRAILGACDELANRDDVQQTTSEELRKTIEKYSK